MNNAVFFLMTNVTLKFTHSFGFDEQSRISKTCIVVVDTLGHGAPAHLATY